MTVSVVLFDLDDTLFDHRGAVDGGIRAHRRSHPALMAADDALESERWTALEELHYHRYLAGELDFAGQRRARALGFLEPFAIALTDAEADHWFDAYFERYREAWQLHPDALPTLDALAHLRLGIITNGELSFQTTKLERLLLHDRMEHVVASGELGITKPDPRIFEHTVALFDVSPEAAAYVGDRLETDAIGAASAGLTGIWLARHGATAEQRGRAASAGVHVIRGLDELPALLP